MIPIQTRSTSASTAITILASALLALGVVMVFSAGVSLDAPPFGASLLRDPSVRQASYTFLGLLTLLIVGYCPHQFWAIRRKTWFQPGLWFLVFVVALLAVVLVPGIGQERNGARRWLAMGSGSSGLGFQPSELAKLAVVIFISSCCAHIGPRIRSFWTGLLPLILTLGILAGLIGKEDFGTAALVGAVGGCLLLAAGARLWHLALLSLPALAGLGYLILHRSYRMERIYSFLDPYKDPQGSGYHQIQSLITIASGGWWGRGLGAGIQKYGYLPEGRTDFIFAVICEELGIVGGAVVIALFALLVWQGRRAMICATSEFGRLIALGVTLTIGLQAAMNIAVVTVSVPTKGIGLPLVSAGGSGVIFYSVLVGLLANVARGAVAAPAIPAISHRGRPRSTGRPADYAPILLSHPVGAATL